MPLSLNQSQHIASALLKHRTIKRALENVEREHNTNLLHLARREADDCDRHARDMKLLDQT